MPVDLTSADGVLIARFNEGASKAEQFGLRQSFTALVSSPFTGFGAPPGDYTFRIFVDGAHIHILEDNVVDGAFAPRGDSHKVRRRLFRPTLVPRSRSRWSCDDLLSSSVSLQMAAIGRFLHLPGLPQFRFTLVISRRPSSPGRCRAA